MKTLRATTGPFHERPFFSDEEIEQTCINELRKFGLFPTSPEPIRIDRFIEKRFGFAPSYEPMGKGILGYSEFGESGVVKIIISRELDESDTLVDQRRLRTTMAHETGHCLLHSHLFALTASNESLFGQNSDVQGSKILCRDEVVSGSADKGSRYNGRWWEFQANQVMGAILLPKPLVLQSLVPYLISEGKLGAKTIASARREEAARQLADIFDVNPAVVRIRLNVLYPINKNVNQLSL